MPKSPFTGTKPWILLPEPSPLGPAPITLMADGERIDNNLPYYVRSKYGRNQRSAIVKLCDSFGTHLICPRQTCRRAGACSDADLTKLPYCFHRFRESLRHALYVAMEAHGMYGIEGNVAAGLAAWEEPDRERPKASLVQTLLEAGAPRAVLERPTSVDETTWTHERDPAALAHMASVRQRRLAREAREKKGRAETGTTRGAADAAAEPAHSSRRTAPAARDRSRGPSRG